jgi:hypothetical protein
MQQLNITTKTQGLPYELVCNILSIALQDKDADMQRMQAKIDALESRLNNNCVGEVTVASVREDFHDRNGEYLEETGELVWLRDVPDYVIDGVVKRVVSNVQELWENDIEKMVWDHQTDLYTHRESIYDVIYQELQVAAQDVEKVWVQEARKRGGVIVAAKQKREKELLMMQKERELMWWEDAVWVESEQGWLKGLG